MSPVSLSHPSRSRRPGRPDSAERPKLRDAGEVHGLPRLAVQPLWRSRDPAVTAVTARDMEGWSSFDPFGVVAAKGLIEESGPNETNKHRSQ